MKKIVKSLKGASFLIKCVSEKVEKEIKKTEKAFLSMLAATLCARLL